MKLIVEKRKELDMCFIVIETALYLLWAHLDYFALQAIPATVSSAVRQSSCEFNGILSSQIALVATILTKYFFCS